MLSNPLRQGDHSWRSEALRLAILGLLCFLLFFLNLGSRAIWDIDEGMHAATSRNMIRSGDWVMTTHNGEPWYDKPPLFNWLVALSFTLFGFTEFAARFPAALLGAGTILLVYGFGRRMIGTRAAFLGAVMLACSVQFVIMSRVVMHDILLVFCVTLALLAFYRAYVDEARRTIFLAIFWAACGLSVLAKGPVGAALIGLTVLVFLAARRDLRLVPKLMLVRGLLIMAAVALPWYILISLRDPDYLTYFLLAKNLGSVVSTHPTQVHGYHHYVYVFLVGFIPWSCFMPVALWRLLRRPRNLSSSRTFLLLWLGVVFSIFTIATTKHDQFIMPLYPAAALLLGDLWDRLIAAPDAGLRRAVIAAQSCLVVLVTGLVVFYWSRVPDYPDMDTARYRDSLVWLSIVVVAPMLVSLLPLLTGRYRALLATSAAWLTALIVIIEALLTPTLDADRSSRTIALRLDATLPRGEKLVFYRWLRDSALFYTERQAEVLKGPDDLEAYLRQEGALCLVDRDAVREQDGIASLLEIVEEHGDEMIVTGARAGR